MAERKINEMEALENGEDVPYDDNAGDMYENDLISDLSAFEERYKKFAPHLNEREKSLSVIDK